jgi:rubrerythrin
MANEQFCKLLKEAIADEDKAPKDYEKLLEKGKEVGLNLKAPIIDRIIPDERRHLGILENIKREVCK